LETFIQSAYDKEQMEKMKDVYITNHEPKGKKYHTNNQKED